MHDGRVTPLVAWLIGSFAVWRLTHLLHAEDGPWDAVAKWRERLAGGPLARMVACFYCLSMWVALPFALWIADVAAQWPVALAAWPALSGAAIVIERLSDRSPTAAWFEEPPRDEGKTP